MMEYKQRKALSLGVLIGLALATVNFELMPAVLRHLGVQNSQLSWTGLTILIWSSTLFLSLAYEKKDRPRRMRPAAAFAANRILQDGDKINLEAAFVRLVDDWWWPRDRRVPFMVRWAVRRLKHHPESWLILRKYGACSSSGPVFRDRDGKRWINPVEFEGRWKQLGLPPRSDNE